MRLEEIPEWLAAALFAAALATLGFVGKQILEWLIGLRTAHRARQARLVSLLSLLRGSAAVFRVQVTLRERLHKSLGPRADQHDGPGGYEAVFTAAFKTFSPEERELHGLIRSYTINGLRPLNEGILRWLEEDTEFKLEKGLRHHRRRLAAELAALEPHLRLWLAKYAAWIPDSPEHALVYLADEENHGVAFPRGIETTIEQTLGVSPLLNSPGHR